MKAINRDNGHDADSKSLQLGDMVLTATASAHTQHRKRQHTGTGKYTTIHSMGVVSP